MVFSLSVLRVIRYTNLVKSETPKRATGVSAQIRSPPTQNINSRIREIFLMLLQLILNCFDFVGNSYLLFPGIMDGILQNDYYNFCDVFQSASFVYIIQFSFQERRMNLTLHLNMCISSVLFLLTKEYYYHPLSVTHCLLEMGI